MLTKQLLFMKLFGCANDESLLLHMFQSLDSHYYPNPIWNGCFLSDKIHYYIILFHCGYHTGLEAES